jgi:restriction system protein
MTIPDYESLMPIVLELAGREQPIREPVETISDRLELSVEERAQLIPSGGKTLIKSRIEWAVTYLVHAGLLKRPRRGHFVITERGQEIIANPPPKIDQQFLRQYPEFISFITRRRSDGIEPITTASAAESPDEGRTPEERIGGAYEILAPRRFKWVA